MTKKATKKTTTEINAAIENGLLNLWSKDLASLVSTNRHEEAISASKYLAVPEKEIRKLIKTKEKK
ncbi:MAG: hypothetical protein H8E55_01435 [Pelagibacterales bacterium]|nr:hypothetical protein [Pelagibacterales bacterium]